MVAAGRGRRLCPSCGSRRAPPGERGGGSPLPGRDGGPARASRAPAGRGTSPVAPPRARTLGGRPARAPDRFRCGRDKKPQPLWLLRGGVRRVRLRGVSTERAGRALLLRGREGGSPAGSRYPRATPRQPGPKDDQPPQPERTKTPSKSTTVMTQRCVWTDDQGPSVPTPAKHALP
ncbi:synapsin-1-like [Symphalangus syndactylus]|uniref:synapsin-1-like n=1 Tax=Symphalangus syndactylus TaxID=9590 RepID=UPI003004857D